MIAVYLLVWKMCGQTLYSGVSTFYAKRRMALIRLPSQPQILFVALDNSDLSSTQVQTDKVERSRFLHQGFEIVSQGVRLCWIG